MANPFYLETAAKLAIAERQFPPTCLDDIKIALADVPDAEVATALPEWCEKHKDYAPTLHPINEELEAKAFGQNNITAQGQLHKEYEKLSPTFFAERKAAYAAAAKTGDAATVDKAKKIVADADSNSPFNPAKKYPNDQVRINEIAKFIRAFGAKSAARSAAKFNVDLAGRPLRKRA